MQCRLALVVLVPYFRDAQKNAHVVVERGIAVHLDAERFADRTLAARTIDEIARRDRLARRREPVVHGRDDTIAFVAEGFELAVIAERYRFVAQREIAQNWIEPDLI